MTYLKHSGFLLETKCAVYLFDYIGGKLPEWNEELPLYVFSSHAHDDHFSTEIFSRDLEEKVNAYVLSSDIFEEYKKESAEWMVKQETHIHWIREREELILGDTVIRALHSTDMGVAFLIKERSSGRCIYHAGDLNWWHWNGEDEYWNWMMEVNYKKEIDSISAEVLDVAFIPLDPRQENAYCFGMDYLLSKKEINHVFPMHFWKDHSIIHKYKKECHPDYKEKIYMIECEGQQYEI